MNLKPILKPFVNAGVSILLLLIGVVYITLTDGVTLESNVSNTSNNIVQNTNVNSEDTGNVQGVQTNIGNPGSELYKVTKVVDGDTIKVDKLGTIRMIGIDTPETVDPRKDVQCFGLEASEKAKELLDQKNIRVEYDSTQGATDKYGRVLAYVYTEDGKFFNLEMIAQGYAFEYTYSTPYIYQKEFKEAQSFAKTNLLGLWSSKCNY